MNTARAGKVGHNRIQLLQLAGSLDAVVAVVGKYPEAHTGERRYDQFVAHMLADTQAHSGRLRDDQYQFPAELPSMASYHAVQDLKDEHEYRNDYRRCTFKCEHPPAPSLFPNLNWTFDKGHASYDMRRAEFGRSSGLDAALDESAPGDRPLPGYESALGRLKVMVGEAVSLGLRALRVVISATNPLSLPPHRFSDRCVRDQQVLINRCAEVCREIGSEHVDLELRDVDSLRRFVGPTTVVRPYHFKDHVIPQW